MADFADCGNEVVLAQGDKGIGVGWVCSSSAGGVPFPLPVAPGSRNEKKLCDIECLWWCPRRADVGVCARAPVSSSGESAPGGGRPPNVKPAPRGVIGWAPGRLMLDPAEGIVLTGASMSPSPGITSSCAPSSAMAAGGRVPGRGKNTERLREWSRACRRDGFAAPLLVVVASGAE